MKKSNENKVLYTAPQMKSTEFHVEQGYATSVTSNSVRINMSSGTL